MSFCILDVDDDDGEAKEEKTTQLVIMKTKSIIFLSKSHWMCVHLMCVHHIKFNNVSMLRSTTSAPDMPKTHPGK